MITATMVSSYPMEEVIRGRLGTIKFVKDGFQIIGDDPNKGAGLPARLEKTVEGQFVECKLEKLDTEALWEHFLECVRSKKREPLNTPDLGAAAFTTVPLVGQTYPPAN